jgi:hypothetical protein
MMTVGLDPVEAQSRPIDDATFDDVERFAREQRATGLLVHAIDTGTIAVRADQRARAVLAHEQQLADCLRLEALLVTVAQRFRAANVEFRVLKGPAFARRWYPALELRTFGDIDLLVRPRDWDRAAADLERGGCTRRYREPRPGFTARFGKGACFVAPSGLEIDLHRTFVAGPYGLGFDPDELFGDPQTIAVGGGEFATLPDPVLALHAAVHGVLGNRPPRSVPLRDLAQALHAGVDPLALIEVAQRLSLSLPLSRAVVVLAEQLGVVGSADLQRWAEHYRAQPREARAMAAYTATTRRYARQAFEGLSALPNARTRFAYARALALPDRSYLRERDRTLGRRLGRAASLARLRRNP